MHATNDDLPELDHFLTLARHGRHRGASGGAQAARKLADAALKHALILDDQAVEGLCQFVRLAKRWPQRTREAIR